MSIKQALLVIFFLNPSLSLGQNKCIDRIDSLVVLSPSVHQLMVHYKLYKDYVLVNTKEGKKSFEEILIKFYNFSIDSCMQLNELLPIKRQINSTLRCNSKKGCKDYLNKMKMGEADSILISFNTILEQLYYIKLRLRTASLLDQVTDSLLGIIDTIPSRLDNIERIIAQHSAQDLYLQLRLSHSVNQINSKLNTFLQPERQSIYFGGGISNHQTILLSASYLPMILRETVFVTISAFGKTQPENKIDYGGGIYLGFRPPPIPRLGLQVGLTAYQQNNETLNGISFQVSFINKGWMVSGMYSEFTGLGIQFLLGI